MRLLKEGKPQFIKVDWVDEVPFELIKDAINDALVKALGMCAGSLSCTLEYISNGELDSLEGSILVHKVTYHPSYMAEKKV